MSKTPQDSTCLQMFHELDTLWMGLEPKSPRSGFEAYESLFDDGLHPRLRALAQRRDEFKAVLTGDVHQIDNFAVTSGHEALAIYAERVAAFVGVRKSSIPLQRQELDAARVRGEARSVAKHEQRLNDLGEDLVKTIVSAFNGWEQHRAWIQRSIEREQAHLATLAQRVDSEPSQPPLSLKFPRNPDAMQRCLEALNAAPNGIPGHREIAGVTNLEYQTVKEAMGKLKKAGRVVKEEGAWVLTDAGRDHLKLLRGE